MKKRLLDFLCCPDCRNEKLDLAIRLDAGNEEQTIMEGEIRCGECGSGFPIIKGIPRMLPILLRPMLFSFHREFFERHPDLNSKRNDTLPNEDLARTMEGFSYQHVQLDDQRREVDRWKNNLLNAIPVGPEFFKGKTGADIGCGTGRHLYWAHEFGAEIVGLDLSEGVAVASTNTVSCPRCHVVQGDIYHLPFKNGVFEFAYSIGVLHHLPDPQEGFRWILPSIKPGGRFFVWVYGLSGMRLWYRLSHMTWLRGITPHLPAWTQHLVSALIAVLLELLIWMPCRVASLFPGGERIVGRVPLGDACRRSFRAKIRSVFDRINPPVTHYHSAEELEGWLKDGNLTHASVLNRDGRGWTVTGVKEQEPDLMKGQDRNVATR